MRVESRPTFAPAGLHGSIYGSATTPGVGEYDVGDVIRDEGRMIELVLPLLYIAAERYEIDVALCIADGGAYYVAQVMREKCCPFEGGPVRRATALPPAAALRGRV